MDSVSTPTSIEKHPSTYESELPTPIYSTQHTWHTRLWRRCSSRLDTYMPTYRTYLGLSRRTFLFCLLGILAALILIIGLAAGLTHHGHDANLPLPSNTKVFTGDLTYYGVGLGACGITSQEGDAVVAVSHVIFDAASRGSDPNANPLCGQRLRAQRFDQQVGKVQSVDLTVVDRCVGCEPTDLDTSTAMFDRLAPQASGRVDVSWAWLTPAATAS